jgi:hypothetical protein
MGRGTGSRKPFTHGGTTVIFAIDDALFDELRPHLLASAQAATPGIPVEIVRASTLTDPQVESDMWFGPPPAKRPGFTLLCETQARQIFEQQVGTEVWPEAPVAIGTPMLDVHGKFRLLYDGLMLFQAADGRMRVTGIPLITGLYNLPILRPPYFPIDSSWFDRAPEVLGPGMR